MRHPRRSKPRRRNNDKCEGDETEKSHVTKDNLSQSNHNTAPSSPSLSYDYTAPFKDHTKLQFCQSGDSSSCQSTLPPYEDDTIILANELQYVRADSSSTSPDNEGETRLPLLLGYNVETASKMWKCGAPRSRQGHSAAYFFGEDEQETIGEGILALQSTSFHLNDSFCEKRKMRPNDSPRSVSGFVEALPSNRIKPYRRFDDTRSLLDQEACSHTIPQQRTTASVSPPQPCKVAPATSVQISLTTTDRNSQTGSKEPKPSISTDCLSTGHTHINTLSQCAHLLYNSPLCNSNIVSWCDFLCAGDNIK